MEQSRDGYRTRRAKAGGGADGKYMTFQLASEVYGLEILAVREIIGFVRPTPMPHAPPAVNGVINLRGRIIPVMSLRAKLGMAQCAATEQSVIIVVQCPVAGRSLTMGLMVDLVLEVKTFNSDQIDLPPDAGPGVAADFLLGVGLSEKEIVLLLDVTEVLAGGGCRAVECGNRASA